MKIASTLILTFFLLVSCEDQITSGCEIDIPGRAPEASLSWIQENVFDAYCTSCHGNSLAQGGLNLASRKALANLLDKKATASTLKRIDTQNPENSYLLIRLEGSNGESVMPPSGKLNQAVIDSVRSWIEKGALDN